MSAADLIARLFKRHRHEWEDQFVFDSCISVAIPSGEQRVLARAVLMRCNGCGAIQRRHYDRDALMDKTSLTTARCSPRVPI